MRLLAAGLCALLSATPALAGIGKGNGEIGFDFGATDFDQNVSRQSAGRLSFRGGYHVSRLFEVEGEISASAHYNLNLQNTTRADVVLTTVFANGASLAGHCTVEDDVVLGAFAAVRQFCRVGRHAFVGAFAPLNKDVLPYLWTSSERPTTSGRPNKKP